MLRGQDILLLLRIVTGGPASYAELGRSIGISASQAHAAAKRANVAGLLRPDMTVRSGALFDVLMALRYFLPAVRGGEVRGIPTGSAAEPLVDYIMDRDDRIPVWPHPMGEVRGLACEPIYKTAPDVALGNPEIYAYLALIDTLRIGNQREQHFARQRLSSWLQ